MARATRQRIAAVLTHKADANAAPRGVDRVIGPATLDLLHIVPAADQIGPPGVPFDDHPVKARPAACNMVAGV